MQTINVPQANVQVQTTTPEPRTDAANGSEAIRELSALELSLVGGGLGIVTFV